MQLLHRREFSFPLHGQQGAIARRNRVFCEESHHGRRELKATHPFKKKFARSMIPLLLKELRAIEGSTIAQVTNDIEKGWKDMHSLLEKISNSGTLKPVLQFPFVSRGREGVENETNVLRFACFCELLRRFLPFLGPCPPYSRTV